MTEKEFIALPPGDVDPAFQESDRMWQEERRKEFRIVIDLDKNGIVTREELQVRLKYCFKLCTHYYH